MCRNTMAVLVTLMAASVCFAWPLNQKSDTPKVDLQKMKATVEMLETRVTLDFVETPLPDVVKFLGDFSKLRFGSSFEKLPDVPIMLTAFDQPLGESLQKILDHCEWTYAIKPDGEILLQPVPKPKN